MNVCLLRRFSPLIAFCGAYKIHREPGVVGKTNSQSSVIERASRKYFKILLIKVRHFNCFLKYYFDFDF